MSYIGANEFVFNNDKEGGIHSGGFSVNSIMMKGGISPIMTLNDSTAQKGGANKVSDLFNDLVVPNWVLSYPTIYGGTDYRGGGDSTSNNGSDVEDEDKDEDKDEEDDVIDDDIHEKLLDLVKQDDIRMKNKKKRATKKNIKQKAPKLKGGTKKQKY
jgi:hypothetical protein